MAIGTLLSSKFQELKAYLGSDGKVIEGNEDKANKLAEEIETLSGIPVKIGGLGYVQIGSEEYTDVTAFSDAFTERAEKNTNSAYFPDGKQIYAGVLTSTDESVQNMVRAIAAASGNGIALLGRYNSADRIGTLNDQEHGFSILITPSDGQTHAQVYVAGPDQMDLYSGLTLPLFNEMIPETSGKLNIMYFIFKGKSGDCYLKGFYTDSTTPPDEENAEDFFSECHMNCYDITREIYSDGTYEDTFILSDDPYGGFAIISMVEKIEQKSFRHDLVLFSRKRTPLMCIHGEIDIDLDLCVTEFNQVITNNYDSASAPAPIYTPTTETYASEMSYWGIIVPKDGYYYIDFDLSYYGAKYVYDHGFVMRTN